VPGVQAVVHDWLHSDDLLSLLAEAMEMNFKRIQGGSGDGLETHQSTYYKVGLRELLKGVRDFERPSIEIADPFARNCPWGTHTNDIDPSTKAHDHLDALEWLREFSDGYFDHVLFDPPFSQNQAERYEAGHVNIYTSPGYVKGCTNEIFRILKPGGTMLKLGYNSARPNGFEISKGWVVNFGGNRNDVLMTILVKSQMVLEDF
jgi:hypothetical protein